MALNRRRSKEQTAEPGEERAGQGPRRRGWTRAALLAIGPLALALSLWLSYRLAVSSVRSTEADPSAANRAFLTIAALVSIGAASSGFQLFWAMVSGRGRAERGREQDPKLEPPRSEFSAAALLGAVPVGIVTIDTEGVVTSLNAAAERTFGTLAESVAGEHAAALFTWDQGADPAAEIAGWFRSASGVMGGQPIEAMGRRPGGKSFRVEVALGKAHLEGNELWIAVVRELSERAEAEPKSDRHENVQESTEPSSLEPKIDEPKIAQQTAEPIPQARDEFLSAIGHDIQVPMNTLMHINRLLLDTDLDERQSEYVAEMAQSSDAMMGVIEDLLDFATLSIGDLDLQVIDFDLHAALSKAVHQMSGRAEAKGLEIASLINADIPTAVRGDPGRLRQILGNLLDNAIRNTSEGEIVVTVSLVRQSDTQVGIKVTVSDSGVGIESSALAKIFESAPDADRSDTGRSGRRPGGAALGLTVCKQLCELMKGEIGARSVVGEGSLFWFTAELEKQPNAPEQTPLPAHQTRGLRIMIVGRDKGATRNMLVEQVSLWGCQFDEANSGNEALDKLRAAADRGIYFHMAFIDAQISDMDAEALARAIKAESALAQLPLALLTPHGKRGDAQRMKEAGFSSYITRPIQASDLYDCMATVLGQRTSSNASRRAPLVTRHSINEARRNRVRILVAAGALSDQVRMARCLGKTGHRCDVVTGGALASITLQRLPYDLVFLDRHMPEMDGIEVTQSLRRHEGGLRRARVVGLARDADEGKQCLKAGMDDFLCTPFNDAAVMAMAQKWLSRDEKKTARATPDAIGSLPEIAS